MTRPGVRKVREPWIVGYSQGRHVVEVARAPTADDAFHKIIVLLLDIHEADYTDDVYPFPKDMGRELTRFQIRGPDLDFVHWRVLETINLRHFQNRYKRILLQQTEDWLVTYDRSVAFHGQWSTLDKVAANIRGMEPEALAKIQIFYMDMISMGNVFKCLVQPNEYQPRASSENPRKRRRRNCSQAYL